MALSIWSNIWIVSKFLVFRYFQDTFWILFGVYPTLTKILGLKSISDLKIEYVLNTIYKLFRYYPDSIQHLVKSLGLKSF